jgi:hypothetical protein
VGLLLEKTSVLQSSKILYLDSFSPFPLFLFSQFADQESQVAHLELGQVEYQLKTTLEVLRERSLQCENLKDTVENLK